MSRLRTHQLTPWGKEVQKQMIDKELSAAQIVDVLRERGLRITRGKFSSMLTGMVGARSPEMVQAIDELLGIPADVSGRPA